MTISWHTTSFLSSDAPAFLEKMFDIVIELIAIPFVLLVIHDEVEEVLEAI